MARRGSDFDAEMAQLEAEIKRLEIEYNMFFAGRLPRLPWETRARVEKIVKRYDRMHIANTAARFRFNTIQTRFMSFCELWERSLKAKEEGRPQRGRSSEPQPAQPPAPEAPPQPAPPPQSVSPPPPAPKAAPAFDTDAPAAVRVVHVAAIKNASDESDQLKNLYERLSRARQEAGEAPLPYKSFANVIKAQVSKLSDGDGEVAFRIAVKDGKVTLTAKRVKD
jgi:hypothetical protein